MIQKLKIILQNPDLYNCLAFKIYCVTTKKHLERQVH
jgi:hypothetical protein